MMDDSEEEVCLSATQLAVGSVLPMVLRSAIELDLFELIKKPDQPNVSASELAAKLSTTNPDAPDLLDRILRYLAIHSVLTCSGGTGGERRYSLTPMGKFFTKDKDGISIAQFALLVQDKVVMESWYNLKDAIMEGGTPFSRAHGMGFFEFADMDHRLSNLFKQAMSYHSSIYMKQLMHIYKGFEGLKTLVDVGGGIGTTLNIIVSKYPSIKAINFDLSHVVRDAPSFPGVEHVGGDMFISVPKADAIFMKCIIHDWSDAKCLKILKNCKEALPENGKVIIFDFVLPNMPKNGQTCYGVESDMMMLTFTGGKERTEIEFQALAKAAGFKEFRNVCSVVTIGVLELYK